MKQKKWWILGGAAALVLALVLILTLGGRDRQGEIVTPGRDTLNIPMIPGFTPGANAPSGETEPTQAAELDALTKSVVQAAVRDLQVPERVVSVAIETVPPEQWEKRVYEPLIQDRPELKKAPEY